MRIVHTRKKVFDCDYAFKQKFTLLVWILSILKWKQYGNEVVLYADNETLEKIKEFGFDNLYDEINTDLFENGDMCQDIDFYWFWATPKIIALHYETYHLGNKPVIADMDVVPMSDISRLWNLAQVVVWSNKEYAEFTSIYPKLCELSLGKDYELPEWFTGKAKPLNTGVIYFKNNEHAIEFSNEVLRYVKHNENLKENTRVITMCNAEQRMIGEFVKHKNLTYTTIQPINEGLFNKNAFHSHGYKNYVYGDEALNWHLHLLLAIQKIDINVFSNLINHEFFADEKKYLLENGENFESVKELDRYN